MLERHINGNRKDERDSRHDGLFRVPLGELISQFPKREVKRERGSIPYDNVKNTAYGLIMTSKEIEEGKKPGITEAEMECFRTAVGDIEYIRWGPRVTQQMRYQIIAKVNAAMITVERYYARSRLLG